MRTIDLILALVVMAGGLAALFLAWRGRNWPQGRRRIAAAGGWILVASSLAIWAGPAASGLDGPDVGVAQAVVAAILLALAGVGAHSLGLPAARNPPREIRTAAGVAPPTSRLAVAHGGARLVGSLAAAPAFGLSLGLLAARWGPGDPATRLVEAAFAVVLATAAGLVCVLASTRPVRAAGGLGAGTAVLATFVVLAGAAA